MGEMQFTVLPHPPYSPDLAPSDFYLFRHMKKALRGQHFSDGDSLKGFVENWFESHPQSFFREAICWLHRRWMKTVDADEFYIEK